MRDSKIDSAPKGTILYRIPVHPGAAGQLPANFVAVAADNPAGLIWINQLMTVHIYKYINHRIYLSQGVNSGARASTMRGRVGVIFQGRGFESHRRRVLQFFFQRKRGRPGSKIFAVAN